VLEKLLCLWRSLWRRAWQDRVSQHNTRLARSRPRPRPNFLVSDRFCPKTDGLRPYHWISHGDHECLRTICLRYLTFLFIFSLKVILIFLGTAFTSYSCGRGNVLAVGNCCYVAVWLGGARRFGAHRGGGAGAYRGGRPPTACSNMRPAAALAV